MIYRTAGWSPLPGDAHVGFEPACHGGETSSQSLYSPKMLEVPSLPLPNAALVALNSSFFSVIVDAEIKSGSQPIIGAGPSPYLLKSK